MGSVKTFLLGYVALYMFIAIGLNVTMGPPGMSREYLETYKNDHDHYIETTKRDDYKRWSERPELNPPSEALQASIDFVEEYESRPEFKAEEARRHKYDILFDVFNMSMVVILITRFARKPLAGLLDGMIDQVRQTLEKASAARNEARQRKAQAQSDVNKIDQVQADYEAETAKRIEIMRRDSALATGESMSAMNKETEDRKLNEAAMARRALKEELVEAALAALVLHIQENPSTEREDELIHRFVQGLEHRS
jgi:F0F1-type ATP synthase membrane subunit b/b'